MTEACLIQDNKPVAFASKALTSVEARYANIERELLAVVYGCERFHTYLYGRSFTVESDHKPLESIHLNNLIAAPRRLRRMLLRLQPYNVVIRYRPGKEMTGADSLSRLSREDEAPVEDMDVEIHDIFCRPDYGELIALKEVIHVGWPTTIKDLSGLLRPYWNYRDELSFSGGILLKGSRVILPQVLQKIILSKLHAQPESQSYRILEEP